MLNPGGLVSATDVPSEAVYFPVNAPAETNSSEYSSYIITPSDPTVMNRVAQLQQYNEATASTLWSNYVSFATNLATEKSLVAKPLKYFIQNYRRSLDFSDITAERLMLPQSSTQQLHILVHYNALTNWYKSLGKHSLMHNLIVRKNAANFGQGTLGTRYYNQFLNQETQLNLKISTALTTPSQTPSIVPTPTTDAVSFIDTMKLQTAVDEATSIIQEVFSRIREINLELDDGEGDKHLRFFVNTEVDDDEALNAYNRFYDKLAEKVPLEQRAFIGLSF